MGASTTKTTDSAMETASMKASATMETATHAAMEAAATASMETTAPTTVKAAPAPDTSRLGLSAYASPNAPARIPASANEIRLPHIAPCMFSSALVDGGWEGRLSNRRLRATAACLTLSDHLVGDGEQ